MLRYLLLILFTFVTRVWCQVDSITLPASRIEDLDFLVIEAMLNNPEINAAVHEMDLLEHRERQAGTLADPELRFMQEGMPGFKYNEAMFSRLELMQMFMFPTKYGTAKQLARVRAEHAHHDHLEKAIDIIARLKESYFELWFVQQNAVLAAEQSRLLDHILSATRSRYEVGRARQQDVLKAGVERGMVRNELLSLRQQELSAKAMLASFLNRNSSDTLGYAVIPEDYDVPFSLDSLLHLAFGNRPMIIHDSLMIEEGRSMLTMAKQEYLPDFRLGIEHMSSPMDEFTGWSVTIGMTIPFAPWTLGKAGAKVDEAEAGVRKAESLFRATRNMVAASIKDLHGKTFTAKRQLDAFGEEILPQARQALDAAMIAFQSGEGNFIETLDAYRVYVSVTKEYYMLRMQFEQFTAQLSREVGIEHVAQIDAERNNQ